MKRSFQTDVMEKQEECLSEELTGWALNPLFRMHELPNPHTEFPWRAIRKIHGVVRGTVFVVTLLTMWTLELIREVLWSGDLQHRMR